MNTVTHHAPALEETLAPALPDESLRLAPAAIARSSEPMGLEEYYEEAGPDYAAWSREFNMHFGYFRLGMNPLRREPMLERMNVEVRERLHLDASTSANILDLGCGLGGTLRSLARRLPLATLTGVTLVPWQVQRARALNEAAVTGSKEPCGHIDVLCADYENTHLPSGSMDAAYALESSCHAHTAGKRPLLQEAHRLLRSGGRLVVADGFLRTASALHGPQRPIYRKLCQCWVIPELGELDLFLQEMRSLGFADICVESLQYRVAPSVFHIPWVTLKFLVTDVVFGKRRMTRARWNNVIAPLLLPLLGVPGGPMVYCMISATKP